VLVGTFEFEPRIRADLSRPGFLASAIEQHVTLGTDKAYDVTAFVQELARPHGDAAHCRSMAWSAKAG